MKYTMVGTDEGSNITVFVEGKAPLVAHSTHPNYEKIRQGVLNNDESVIDLFDIAQTAAMKFERLGDQVTTANGRLYFDGAEVDNSLAKQVVRFLKDGVEDWKPLVKFFEHVQQNPNEHSRKQLFDWLDKRDFTITQDGLIVGYKGVNKTENGEFVSVHSGTATVNGVVHTGQIPNPKGAVVEMPRNEVQHDPSVGCNTGLHVGTYDYALGYATRGALLEVHVNPRDVVSVPTDCDWAKVRVCRYTVVDTIEAKYESAVLDNDLDDVDPEDEETANDVQPAPSNDNAVNVGDRFEDHDKRRQRVLVVEAVDGDTIRYTVEGKDQKGKVALRRLLTPYRFRKV